MGRRIYREVKVMKFSVLLGPKIDDYHFVVISTVIFDKISLGTTREVITAA